MPAPPTAASLLERIRARVAPMVERGRDLVELRRKGRAGAASAPMDRRRDGNGGRDARPPALPVTSVAEYFDTLGDRFVPEGARGVEAVFQWKLSGDGGAARYAVVRDGELELHEGEHVAPTVTIAMGASDYVRMVNNEIDGAREFTSGRAKLKGSIPMAMKMRKIFPT